MKRKQQGVGKKLPNKKLHSVYSLINITSANKSRRLIRILTWQEVQKEKRKEENRDNF